MKNQKEREKDVRFELDGVLFKDLQSAIASAKESIRKNALSRSQHPEQGFEIISTEFEVNNAYAPPGSIQVVGITMIRRGGGPEDRLWDDGTECTIRRVRPNSPTYGKYVAQFWTMENLHAWYRFNKYLQNGDVITEEEAFFGHLAFLMSLYLSGREPISSFFDEVNRMWGEAKNELERNQTAEALLCAQDLGLLSFHDRLSACTKLALRAEELARIRDEARSTASP
jgi:hypothetical protein